MNEPKQPFEAELDGVPTLMPDAQLPGTAGPGVQIGNFELQTLLGRGGMGEVWKAWDKKADRPVVIKLVPPELQRADEEMARVRDTFRRVHALQHQHICPLYLLDEDLRLGWYLVMKYIDGQTLSAYRATYVARHGSFPLEEVIKVLDPVADALDYAHRQRVIHRDIKPQNVLVVGNADDVQVVDFGLAAEIRSTVSRFSQQQMDTSGTRPYMAPEQWKGRGQDARTDQYALAVVAYELLGGALPFDCADFDILRACVLNDPPEALEDQSPAVNRALLLGLAKRREERFETCCDFVSALSGCTLAESRGAKPVDSRGERSASTAAVDLGSGECAQCRTANEPHRKFCRECAAPLRVQCLKCAVEIPVWDKVCPECGAIQADALAKRQRELETLRAESERLLGEYAFDQAAQTASKLAAEKDHRVQQFKDWGDTFLVTIAEEKRRHEEDARSLFAEAKQHRKTFDYAAAIDALNRVPKPLVTREISSFWDRLIAEQTEADELIALIRERVKQRDLDGLLTQVIRALELRGDRADLQRLREQLEEREERLASQRDQKYAEAQRLLEQGQAREALTLTKGVESAQLRASHIELRKRLEAIVEKEDALGRLLTQSKAEGRMDADNTLTLLAATSEYRFLDQQNPRVNALQDQLLTRFRAFTPDTFRQVSAERFSRLPVELLMSLPIEVLASLPNELLRSLPRELATKLSPSLRSSIGITLVLLPAGEFLMGSSSRVSYAKHDEKPQHRVKISKPFYLGVYPVTQAEYELVMGKNPSNFRDDKRCPVECVSWGDSQEFCRRLSMQEGVTYRLPTEAEWEYACRAGSADHWCFGNDESSLDLYAWYKQNSDWKTRPVGQKRPNAWGLHDMHGNVCEWCMDWWNSTYYRTLSKKMVADPTGPVEESCRVYRGGNWRAEASDCRSACRDGAAPGCRYAFLGFRVVRMFSNLTTVS